MIVRHEAGGHVDTIVDTVIHNGADPVNIGSGDSISIKDLTELIAQLTGFEGRIRWDEHRPDGQPARQLDVTRARKLFGYTATKSFEEGLRETIDWYREQMAATGELELRNA